MENIVNNKSHNEEKVFFFFFLFRNSLSRECLNSRYHRDLLIDLIIMKLRCFINCLIHKGNGSILCYKVFSFLIIHSFFSYIDPLSYSRCHLEKEKHNGANWLTAKSKDAPKIGFFFKGKNCIMFFLNHRNVLLS